MAIENLPFSAMHCAARLRIFSDTSLERASLFSNTLQGMVLTTPERARTVIRIAMTRGHSLHHPLRGLLLAILAVVASSGSSKSAASEGEARVKSLKWPGLNRHAEYTHVTGVVSQTDIDAMLSAIPKSGVWDEDADSVDGMSAFEFVLDRRDLFGGVSSVRGKPDADPAVFKARQPVRDKLLAITGPIIGARLEPLVNQHVSACHGLCKACHSLVRRYLQHERRTVASHFDIQALATVVIGLNRYNVDYHGGLFVTTGQNKSFVELAAGDAVLHGSDLLHGVEVTSGARWSWILWFTDRSDCRAEPGRWHLQEAEGGDPIAMFLRAKRAHMVADTKNATSERVRWQHAPDRERKPGSLMLYEP